MGIITKCVECTQCRAKYRLRYNIGNKYPQSARFPCKTCGEDLAFGYEKEGEKTFKNVCIIPLRMDLEIINLHPELTIDPLLKDDPSYFPSLDFILQQYENGMK